MIFSTYDTLSYIESLQREDPRIKIIKNKKNKRTLYSSGIGSLSAKDKYIFPLDYSNMMFDYDIFRTIYIVANKDSFYILEFKCVFSHLEGNRLLDIIFIL